MNYKQVMAVAVGLALLVPRLAADQVKATGASATGAQGYGAYQTGSGGEFTLTISDLAVIPFSTANLIGVGSIDVLQYYASTTKNQPGSDSVATSPSFQSFCVEGTEYIYPNASADITLSAATKLTGTPLQAGAAWLYAKFAKGTLASYNYGAGREISADLLQKAIWAFMRTEGLRIPGSGDPGSDYSNVFTSAAISALGFAAATGDNSALATPIPVQVLNLWQPETHAAWQDQLVLTGEFGQSIVPDGGLTMAMMGLALVGLSVVRRRYPQV